MSSPGSSATDFGALIAGPNCSVLPDAQRGERGLAVRHRKASDLLEQLADPVGKQHPGPDPRLLLYAFAQLQVRHDGVVAPSRRKQPVVGERNPSYERVCKSDARAISNPVSARGLAGAVRHSDILTEPSADWCSQADQCLGVPDQFRSPPSLGTPLMTCPPQQRRCRANIRSMPRGASVRAPLGVARSQRPRLAPSPTARVCDPCSDRSCRRWMGSCCT